MNIELSNKVNNTNLEPTANVVDGKLEFDTSLSPPASIDAVDCQLALDEAQRLLQMIITQLSGAALRKIPPSEYIKLVSVLDDLVSNTINEKV